MHIPDPKITTITHYGPDGRALSIKDSPILVNVIQGTSGVARVSDITTPISQYNFNTIGERSMEIETTLSCAEKHSAKDNITMSVEDLLSLMDSKEIIPEKNKITIEIKHKDDLAKLEGALLSNPDTPFFKQIQELNFKALDINNDIGCFIIALLTKNSNLLPNLTGLAFGDIRQNVDFIFLESFKELTEISIGNISEDVQLSFPKSLDKLKRLSVGHIYKCVKMSLPESLKGLIELSIGNIISNLKLPKTFDKLKCLSIGNIGGGIQLTFPESLKELQRLSIGKIWDYVNLKLPKTLDELKRLSIGAIGYGGQLSFPESLKSLTELFIGDIQENVDLKLLKTLNELKRLSIGRIFGRVQLCLPESKSLTELSIGSINHGVELQFPETLDKLKCLSIGLINISARLSLPESFNGLTELFIGNMEINTKLSLPKTLDKLKRLSIGFISDSAYLKFPKSFPCLEKLFIKQISKTCVQLLGLFEKLDTHKFTFENMDDDVELKSMILQKAVRIRDTVKSICCMWNAELPYIISNLDYHLETVLQLRLVSKGFYELMNYPNGLSAKAIVSFQCKQLYPSDFFEAHKFAFAKNNSIKMALKIKNLSEFKAVLLQEQELINNIEKLDLEKFEVNDSPDGSIHQLLTELKSSASFPSLTTITLGDIHYESIVELPDSLQKLTIGKIQKNITLQLPKGLTMLAIGDINNKVKFNLNLSNCENLINLTIGNVGHYSTLTLPNCSNLRNLTLGNIGSNAKIQFPDLLSKVTNLKIGNVFSKTAIELPNSLSNLKSLTINDIDDNVKIKFPDTFDNLEYLAIRNIESSIKLPPSLKALRTLVLGSIFPYVILDLKNSLDSLTELTISGIRSNLKLPSIESLKILTIGNLYNTLELPGILDNLETLNIRNIAENATLKLPDSLLRLKTIDFKVVHNQDVLTQLKKLQQFTKSETKSQVLIQ